MLFQFDPVMIIRMSVRYESFLHLKLPCALVPSRQPPTKPAVVFSNLTDLISRRRIPTSRLPTALLGYQDFRSQSPSV